MCHQNEANSVLTSRIPMVSALDIGPSNGWTVLISYALLAETDKLLSVLG